MDGAGAAVSDAIVNWSIRVRALQVNQERPKGSEDVGITAHGFNEPAIISANYFTSNVRISFLKKGEIVKKKAEFYHELLDGLVFW